jgi:hypothetical protein
MRSSFSCEAVVAPAAAAIRRPTLAPLTCGRCGRDDKWETLGGGETGAASARMRTRARTGCSL